LACHLRRVLPRPVTHRAAVTATSWAGRCLGTRPMSRSTLSCANAGGMMHIVFYLGPGSNVFETYWTTRRGVEPIDNRCRLLDLTVYGRQGTWEDSPTGWPQGFQGKQVTRADGRPTAQWSRLKAGRSDNNKRAPELCEGSRIALIATTLDLCQHLEFEYLSRHTETC
jgi:Bacterial protein of unknown function (DUF899)